MRPSPSIFLLIAAGWLFVAAPVAASEPGTAFGHRAPHAGALVQSIVERAGLGDTAARLARGSQPSAEDDAAIQDDAPAARIDDGRTAPSLEPLGTLVHARSFLPGHRILSRRSPRGPPVA